MSIQVLPREKGFGEIIGESVSAGAGSMLQQQLSDFYQQQQNRKYALGVGQQLGVPDPEKFAETYRYIPPNQLSDVLRKQAEAFAVLQDLAQSGEDQGMKGFGGLPSKQGLIPGMEPKEPAEIQAIDQAQQPPKEPEYSELSGVEDLQFRSDKLKKVLSPKKFVPPVGEYLKEKRKYQEERAKEHRAELAKYVDSFAPLEDLRSQAKNLTRLEQVLNKYDPNKIQKTLIAALDTGYTDSLRKILTTEDQDIIESLVIPFVRTKDFGGSNPSTKEVLLKMKQYPSVYNSKAANKVLLSSMKSYVMTNLKKAEAAQAIRARNPDAAPSEVKELVDEAIKKYDKDFLENDKTKYTIRQYDKKTKSYRQGTVQGMRGLEQALSDKGFETEVLN
jgi:hypothetical protein